MGLAGSRAADEHGIALVLQEFASGQIPDQGFVDRGVLAFELVDLLGRRSGRWSSGI